MTRWLLGAALAALAAAPAAAQDAAAAVKKGIEAHGGADALKKLVAGTFSMKGKLVINGAEVPFTGTSSYQVPGKFRQEVSIEAAPGMKLPVVVVVNGQKVKQTIAGKPAPLPDAAKAEIVQAAVMQEVTQLVPLLDAARFTLKAEKDEAVNGEPAAVVLVTAKGLNDTRLFFDKKTGLLVRTVRKALSPEGKEVTEETTMSDFAKANGVTLPRQMVIKHDGKPFMTATLGDYKLAETLDPKLFEVTD